MSRASTYAYLLGSALLAAGCPTHRSFTEQRAELECEIDVACGGGSSVACELLDGSSKDPCDDFHRPSARTCLEGLEDRLAEVEEDPAACGDDWQPPGACDAVDRFDGGNRRCNAIDGRPLVHEGGWVMAEATRGRTWSRAEVGALAHDPVLARRAAAQWIEHARAEHSSVAAFARLSMELMAVGAPPELVEGCHRAALDEIGHARLALGLARALGQEPWDLGPLPLVPTRVSSLRQLAIEALVEGCLGEGGAAACAHVAAESAQGPALTVVRTIAEEETRHAALAWSTLRWALEREPSLAGPLTLALADALAERRARVSRLRSSELRREPALVVHGLLDEEQTARIELDVAERIVAPVLAQLVARVGAEVAAPALA